jgi:hypothetical protein
MCSKAKKMPNRFPVVSRTRPFNIVGFEDNWKKSQISNFKKLTINNLFFEVWNPPKKRKGTSRKKVPPQYKHQKMVV